MRLAPELKSKIDALWDKCWSKLKDADSFIVYQVYIILEGEKQNKQSGNAACNYLRLKI